MIETIDAQKEVVERLNKRLTSMQEFVKDKTVQTGSGGGYVSE